MKINTIELIISAVRESQYPTDQKKEFLLVGRSNVGKSSFINSIINRKNYARTSATPGKTQTLNFYKINDEFYLVDAPGYGFAKVRNSLKKKFGLIIENYLKSRSNLQMVFLLIDFRHKPTEDDVLMYNYLKYYNIPVTVVCTKVDKVSKNNHQKNKNVIIKELNLNNENDIILIHDAIRPMLSEEIITNNIATCKQKGNAITYIQCAEAMLESDNKEFAISQIDRSTLVRTQTPQTFYLKDIASLHEEALEKGIKNSVASCTLMLELEKKVYLTLGSEKNLKLTTPDDLEIFKALLSVKRDEWIK